MRSSEMDAATAAAIAFCIPRVWHSSGRKHNARVNQRVHNKRAHLRRLCIEPRARNRKDERQKRPKRARATRANFSLCANRVVRRAKSHISRCARARRLIMLIRFLCARPQRQPTESMICDKLSSANVICLLACGDASGQAAKETSARASAFRSTDLYVCVCMLCARSVRAKSTLGHAKRTQTNRKLSMRATNAIDWNTGNGNTLAQSNHSTLCSFINLRAFLDARGGNKLCTRTV